MTQKWCHLTGSHLEVTVEGRKLAYTVHFTSYKAVARRRRQSHNRKWLTWPQVTGYSFEMTSFHRKSPVVAVEGRKLAYTVHFTFYKAVLAGGYSHEKGNDVAWAQVTGSYPEVMSFHWKSPGSGCRRPVTGIYCTFHFLQGCSLQEEAVTWPEMMSSDLRWPEVTRKWRHLTGVT